MVEDNDQENKIEDVKSEEKDNSQPIVINNKKKFNVYPLILSIVGLLLIVSVTFNILAFVNVVNTNSSITVTANNESVEGNLLVGDNYVCKIDLSNKNNGYLDKVSVVKIVVKKAVIIEDYGYFKGISFGDFSYNEDDNVVVGKTLIKVNAFDENTSSLSFNFCPVATGKGDLEIKVYFNDELIETYASGVKLF